MTDVQELLKAVQRSWWLVALVTLLCAAGAVAYTVTATPRYESRIQLFVAAQTGSRPDPQATYQGGLFTQARVQSYLGVATSPTVTEPVIRRLGLAISPSRLADHIVAVAPQGTVTIDIKVSDSSAAQAQRIALAVGQQFIEVVNGLERPTGRGPSPVKLSVSVPPTRPAAPVSPRTVTNVVAGLLLGLILGLGAALLRSRLDTRIRTPDDLPELLGAPLLGVVPFDRRATAVPAVGLRDADVGRSEALRQLRTSLRFLDPDAPPKVILVTSALPGEGKTTTACGLAMAMAESGADVILVEGDLRRPRLAEYLGLRASIGVSGHLIGDGPVDDLLQLWSPGSDGRAMRVLVAGAVPPNPSELLGSRRMKGLLADLRSRCDAVVIDAAPLLGVTDSAVLSTEADGVLLLARLGAVTRADLGQAVEVLERVHARVLGVVANAQPSGRGLPRYGYDAELAHEPAAAPGSSHPEVARAAR